MNRTPPRTAALAALTATVALAVPAVGSAAQLSGVVVHKDARAHSFVIADRVGRLSELHSRVTPAVGRSVVVTARRLHNGTWQAGRVRQGHAVHSARLRGTVTYVAARSQSFVVSARGVSLLVHRRTRGGVMIRAALVAGTVPTVGTNVTVTTTVGGGGVTATTLTNDGQNTNGVDLEGTVLSIDTAAGTLSLSADDSEQSGGALTVQVPATFNLSQFQVGEQLELIASLNPDGTYTMEQASGDGSAQQASNASDQQGSDGSDQQPSAAATCQAQENDPTFPASHNGLSFTQYYAVNPAEPNDAFGRCVDATASANGGQPSAEQQCLVQRSDPGFPAAHNGETFVQFYSTNPNELNPGDAFGHCVDVLHQQAEASGSGSAQGDGGGSQNASAGSGGGSQNASAGSGGGSDS